MTALTLRWRRSLAPIVLILLAAALLGARGLNAKTYWYDEWWSIYDAGGIYSASFPPAETFVKVAQQDPFHPPGFFVLLGVWSELVGWSEVAARSLSWLAGILAVAAVYRAGAELISRRAGLYAALALGFSAFYLIYFTEVRMYSLVPFLCALGLWCYGRLRRARPTRLRLTVFFFVLVAMLYTHYVAGLLALALGLYHLLFAPKNRAWPLIAWTLIGAGLTFIPWLGVAYGAALVAGADPTRLAVTKSPLEMTSDLLYLFSNGGIALLALLAWHSLQKRRSVVLLLWFVGVVTLALTILVNSRFHFVNNTRHVIALFPVLALIAGAGAARTKAAPVILGLWVAAGLWLNVNPAYFAENWVTVLPWNTLAQELASRAQPGDALVFLNPNGTPAWINEPSADYYLHELPIAVHLLESLPDEPPAAYDAQLQGDIAGAPLVWIAFDPQHRHANWAEDAVQRLPNAGYAACAPALHLPDLTLQAYAEPAAALPYRFGGEVGVRLGLIQPLPAVTTGALRLLLQASVDPALPRGDYSVAVHVETADGQLVAQTDFGLPDGCYVAPIGSLPPGRYRALIMVYRWQTGERLPGTIAGTDAAGDRLLLGEFTVTD